ncbi:hypothetical protein AB0K09_10230 [Streptomyces sp. NPDC049577]|uniref:hypothetical protein n=1 Tax=Streptomyces sp. NPDC049577 TaxID=3155153 RepID=UPI0034126ABB
MEESTQTEDRADGADLGPSENAIRPRSVALGDGRTAAVPADEDDTDPEPHIVRGLD